MNFNELHQRGLELQLTINDLYKSSRYSLRLTELLRGNRNGFLEEISKIALEYDFQLPNEILSLDKTNALAFLLGLQGYFRGLDSIASIQEMSEIWGMSVSRIKTLCQNREIKAKKVGTTWIIEKDQPSPKKYKLDEEE